MKKAMILGIASGLGSLLASHLSSKGWSVYGSARNPEVAAEKLGEIPFEKIIKLDFRVFANFQCLCTFFVSTSFLLFLFLSNCKAPRA